MWPKSYKNYPQDYPLIKEKVEPGRGIVGCEMHDLNGWGETHHQPPARKAGLFYALFGRFFSKEKR